MKTFTRFVRPDLRAPRAGSRTLLRHVAYRAAADTASKAVTLLITVAAARVLPAADFGVLALALTTGWLLGVASDAGLPLYLARRIARQMAADAPPALAAVTTVMRLRAWSAGAAGLAGLTVALALAPDGRALAFLVIVVAQILNAVLDTLSHAYRGAGRSDVESGIQFAQRIATAIAATAVVVVHPSLTWLAMALAVPPAVALLASQRLARRFFVGPAGADVERLSWPRFAHDVAPLGAGIVLSALYFRCDVYFVERWHGLEVAGVYNAAFRIVEALRLVPAALLAVAFPLLCAASDARRVARIGLALAGIGAAAAIGVYAAAPALLGVLYGARFIDAAPALGILAMAVPLFFVNYALTHQVIAWDGQRAYLATVTAALAANVVLNALLIPSGGMPGAAASTVITELVVTAGSIAALRSPASIRRPLAQARHADRGLGS